MFTLTFPNIHFPAARHYQPNLSIWLSVDPMADKYPGVSPYAYCANNPVILKDPNGEDIWEINKYGYARLVERSTTEHKIFLTTGKKKDEFGERITIGMGNNKREVCIDDKNVDKFMNTFHFDKEKKGDWAALINNKENKSLARKFMQEVSQHTDVEWGYTGTKNGLLYISTAHKEKEDACSGTIVQNLAADKNLSFAFHVHHQFNFAGTDDYENIKTLGYSDAIFGIIYQRKLFDFKGNSIEWP